MGEEGEEGYKVMTSEITCLEFRRYVNRKYMRADRRPDELGHEPDLEITTFLLELESKGIRK